jgi:Raf kinase inhibitor-like YbhB/YbcL family protein
MRTASVLLCLLALACSVDSEPGNAQERHALAAARAETRAPATVEVRSAAFEPGGTIPLRHSAYGDGVSPALSWAVLPDGTRSLALMMEDPDATSQRPFVHWLAWNIDPASGGLAEGIAAEAPGLVQGRNGRGANGYFGPRPPGGRPHHYHFQLFALDAPLDLAAGADREALLAAMQGHVLAKGTLVGIFGRPTG